jgi:hypothetical protein
MGLGRPRRSMQVVESKHTDLVIKNLTTGSTSYVSFHHFLTYAYKFGVSANKLPKKAEGYLSP